MDRAGRIFALRTRVWLAGWGGKIPTQGPPVVGKTWQLFVVLS